MIKVRAQGTEEELEWFKKTIKEATHIELLDSSELFQNKGTNKYFRQYFVIERKVTKE